VKKRNSSSGGAALHLGSGYQVRVAGWLAAEMLSGGQGRPFSPGGIVALLRGETQESVDDLLVGTTENRYGFIQAKRAIDFSEKVDSDFGSVIDQMVRQVVDKPAEGVTRPWTRELTPANDRLLLVTSSRSSGTIKDTLREVLARARSLSRGQPLSDAAVSDAERSVLATTIATAMSYWSRATGADATEEDIQKLFSLISIEVLDVETGQIGEREAVRILGTQVIVDRQQEGAAWSSVLKACRTMVERRSGLNADELRQHLEEDGIELKTPEPSQRELQRRQVLSEQIDKLIDEARDAVKQQEFSKGDLLLRRIERDHGSHLNTMQRFRVLTNYGYVEIGLGRPNVGARRFLEALDLQPDDEKAKSNEVLAYYVTGDSPTAFAKADKIRTTYPSSVAIASRWILSSPPEKTAQELEQELSSILRRDGEVCVSLAYKSLNRQDLDAATDYAERAKAAYPQKGRPCLILAEISMGRLMRVEAGCGRPSDSHSSLIESIENHVREAIRLSEIDKDVQTEQEARVALVNVLSKQEKKKDAYDESDRAVQLNPRNAMALRARALAQAAMDLLGESVSNLERAYAIDPRADVALDYGRALLSRSVGDDLKTSINVLTGIDLKTVFPMFRHGFAIQTVQAILRDKDWEKARGYIDSAEGLLVPESTSLLRGLVAFAEGDSEAAERHTLTTQSLLNPSTDIEIKIHLGQLFMQIGKPADALPLYQEAFDLGVPAFDSGRLVDCAARAHEDGVVIQTFRTLLGRGVNDWNTVSFGVQYVQKYLPSEAADILRDFLQVNPDHRFAKLHRSVLGVMHERPEWVTGAIEDLPTVDELPPEHIMQVVHVLRFAGNLEAAVDYAYRYLRLHMKSPEAHRAMVLSMSPVLGPVPTIQPTLETVEVGAAVRYDELPSGEPDWIIIVDADDPVGELKEFPKSSRLAQELLGKKVGDEFILATGFMDRKGIIRQIVPKYVRAYNLCGDRWQIHFPDTQFIQSVHLGATEEEMRATIDRMLELLERQAGTEVQMRDRYNQVSTPLHIFGEWHNTNAYDALISLAKTEDQPVRCTFGTDQERNAALAVLKTAKCLALDLSAVATIRLLDLDHILKTTHFRFEMSEHTWLQLKEKLRDKNDDDKPSLAIGFEDGRRVTYEETVEFKKKRSAANQEFLELIEQHCTIMPAEELAHLPATKREPFERLFGQYGVESMLLGARSDCVLWSDDLVQSHIGAVEFGTRRAWTQVILNFLADMQVVTPKERDAATAKLVGMDYRITFYDAPSLIEAVHLSEAQPWVQPLKTFVQQFSAPNVDLKAVIPILVEALVRLYREPLLPENRCRVATALLDAIWNNLPARRALLELRAKSALLFNLNPVGQALFNNCFDQWFRRMQNPIIAGR
jgi:tetratricopeptide (TPR) repeat protein/transcription elongation GreA/GreB family factor